MKRSFAVGVATGALVALLVLPAVALAFQVTGGGGNQTQNPYGYWYAGKEACAQEGCHASIAAVKTPHSEFVKDVIANPDQLVPAADSGLWPATSPAGGLTVRPRDVYLQLGDHEGFLEYAGQEGSPLASPYKPADDLPLWDPMLFMLGERVWDSEGAKIGNGVYSQSCSQCHNVGVTRPSNATYTLASGAEMSTATPTSVSELGIQCEACHGSGKNPNGHKPNVPGVVGGYQILKAQVCGQCHATAIATPEKNVSGKVFGNPNGFTTDATLSAYVTHASVVETEGQMMTYVNNGGAKPKFLPNGADFSMRHTYYNEWLVNKVPSKYGGEHGHADPVNEAVKLYASTYNNTKCYNCHSGLGFLRRIVAKGPTGLRVVATFPTPAKVAEWEPGISCMVCHSGHVTFREGGGYDSLRKWGNGKVVSCGDCHNWQFEMLDQTLQYETVGGKEYARPSKNARSMHPQRELVTGGKGGSDGTGGMWGVAQMDSAMPDTSCEDCHMPRTHKEGMPADDNGDKIGTRMSHRFRVVEPGDAARWKLRPGGDSCVTDCHTGDVAEYTRADMQAWIDRKRDAVANASAAATATLNTAATDLGLTDWLSFIAPQPASGAAAALSPERWTMLQHAAQNVDFVLNDGSGGIHNPNYALAGLAKAQLWALSADVDLSATLNAGPALGDGMVVTGSLLGVGSQPVAGADVVLETSTDGSTWTTADTGKPDSAGAFVLDTGRIVGSRTYRVRFSPTDGVDFVSNIMPVAVPVTTASVVPAGATSAWLDIPSAQVTLSATPGALTFYSLGGATVLSQTPYTGTISITAEGKTTVSYWSVDANGTEAAQTVPVMIDRGAPAVRSDIATVYANKAVVHAWGTDAGSGVDSMHYGFSASDQDVDGASFTFETYKLGRNDLVVSATDCAGKTTASTLSVWVKAAPSLTRAPSSSKTISRGKSVRFSTRITRGKDAAGNDMMLTGRPVVIQRWSGKKWYTYAKFNSGAGAVSWTKRFKSRGTSYWRWAVPGDSYSYRAYSKSLKVVVK